MTRTEYLTLADLSIEYSRPECTISFSDAPETRVSNSGLGKIGILPPCLPNFLSSDCWTLSTELQQQERV